MDDTFLLGGGSNWVRVQGPVLARQELPTCRHPLCHPPLQALCALDSFLAGSCIYLWASLDHDPPIYIFHVARLTGTNQYTQVFIG
jgi:hypothetical protein